VNISDESGLTVDPDAVGIDLADGLTYRLPARSNNSSRLAEICAICRIRRRSPPG